MMPIEEKPVVINKHRGRKPGSKNKKRGPDPLKHRSPYADMPNQAMLNPVIIDQYSFKVARLKEIAKSRKRRISSISTECGMKVNQLSMILKLVNAKAKLEVMIDIAKYLKCSIRAIAIIPPALDADFTESSIVDVIDYYKLNDPRNDPRYRHNPVSLVTADRRNTSNLDNWVSLPETINPHIEHKIDGMVAFRYQDGHAVIFTNNYIETLDIDVAVEQIKVWGALAENRIIDLDRSHFSKSNEQSLNLIKQYREKEKE